MKRAVSPGRLTQEFPHEHCGPFPKCGQPPGDQPLVRRRRRGHPDVHGSRGHDGGQRRPALHCRRACRRRSSTASGSSPATWPPTPSSCRSPAGSPPTSAAATISCCRSPSSLSPPGSAAWPPALPQLILFRVLQGLAGGGLQPSSQAVLLDSFPREKQGAAMTMFGVAALLGPIVGPTLGGWLVDTYDWRWIFYINLPVGVIGFLACYALLDDPAYLQAAAGEVEEAAAQLRRHRPGAARAGHGLVGGRAQQGAGVGLAGRSVLAGADAVDRVRARAGRPALPGDEVCQPGHQLPGAAGAQLCRVLRDYLLRVRRAVCGDRGVAGFAPDVVRLRCLSSRAWCCRRPVSSRS